MRCRIFVLAVVLGALAQPALAQTPPTSQSLEELIKALIGSSGAGSPSAGSLPPGLEGAAGLEGLLGGKKEGSGAEKKTLGPLGQPLDGPFSRPGGQTTQSFRRDDYVSGTPLSPVVSGTRSLVEAARAAARQRCMKEQDEKKRAACLLEAEQK